MLKTLAIFVLCLAPSIGHAQVATSPEVQIDLYTMDVGEHFTQSFGHAAICTRYPSTPRLDRCYNYGSTDFSDPAGLMWGFVRGESRFWVTTVRPADMVSFYSLLDRTVWLQTIPFTNEQAKAVANHLAFDSLEENKYYQYHHFYDNCATQLRDMIDEQSGGLLSKDSSQKLGMTYRDLTRRGYAELPAFLIGLDHILARTGDLEPTEYEAMFLPEFLREAVHKRLGVEPVVLYQRVGPKLNNNPGLSRLGYILFSLLLVAPIWFGWKRGRVLKRHLALAVAVLSLTGLVVWLLAILSPLPMARYNENLFLLCPADILLLWLSESKRRNYAKVRVLIALLATVLALVGILQQPLWALAVLPILAMLPLAVPNKPPGTLR